MANPGPADRAVDDAVSSIRVLHTPELVGGNPGRLAIAERKLGLQSRCISFQRHPFGYPCDEVIWDSPGSVTVNEIKRLHLLWRAMREFDVIHFNFGMPILPKRLDSTTHPGSRARGLWRSAYNLYASLVEFRDLPLLKKLGKALFVTYQGDDARQGAYCKAHFSVSPIGEVDSNYYTAESDARKQREIAIFERYADGIYALNPDLLHVLPPRTRFLPYGHIDPRDWQPVAPSGTAARPLVVHAPSHRGIKGTRFILDAVERLKAEGVEFDFTLVEGMRNEDARRIYEKADLLIDQLLLGWYGGLAVECMALGKPVICYLREEDLHYLEPEMRAQLPIIRAEPSTFYSILKDCLTARRQHLPGIGALSRAYVERWHDPLRIASFLQGQYVSALQRTGRVFDDPPPRPAIPPAVTAAHAGRKRILIASFSDLADDPRVNRQIRLLAERFHVTAAGFADPRVSGVEFIRIPRTPRSISGKALAAISLKLELFDIFYWTSSSTIYARQALENRTFDLILANDISTLPLACRLSPRHGVIFDAHEYSPREFEDHFLWRFLFQHYNEYLCRKYIPSADGMLTVCEGIADEYRANFGADPKVLPNTPPYHDLAPGETNPDHIHLVHHGVAIPSRKIELMIEMMDHLEERFHLDLMLMPSHSSYFSWLRSLAEKHPRVNIVPPMPMRELPRRLNQYDIGLFLLPPTNFNYLHALPNKLFEFVQARLAVAIGPSPEMARVVRQYDCGVVSADFSPKSLAERLNRLDREQIDRFKQRSHEAAKELCYEKNAVVLLDMVDQLLETG